jgi:hypothetical protein
MVTEDYKTLIRIAGLWVLYGRCKIEVNFKSGGVEECGLCSSYRLFKT